MSQYSTNLPKRPIELGDVSSRREGKERHPTTRGHVGRCEGYSKHLIGGASGKHQGDNTQDCAQRAYAKVPMPLEADKTWLGQLNHSWPAQGLLRWRADQLQRLGGQSCGRTSAGQALWQHMLSSADSTKHIITRRGSH
eukprot:4337953-Amphidinium_carterae.1